MILHTFHEFHFIFQNKRVNLSCKIIKKSPSAFRYRTIFLLSRVIGMWLKRIYRPIGQMFTQLETCFGEMAVDIILYLKKYVHFTFRKNIFNIEIFLNPNNLKSQRNKNTLNLH